MNLSDAKVFGASALNRWSAAQDSPDAASKSTLPFRAVSAPGLVIYSLSISFGVIDWVMSLQARWISTIYGLIFVAGQALAAFCLVVVIEHILGKRKPMSDYLKATEVHDHGKFMLTFVMVWAYFSFSQWLIIWAGNLPEEIRWRGGKTSVSAWYDRRLPGDLPSGWTERIGAAEDYVDRAALVRACDLFRATSDPRAALLLWKAFMLSRWMDRITCFPCDSHEEGGDKRMSPFGGAVQPEEASAFRARFLLRR